ncbi:MAG: apolipoprotein N-acyltransferase [Bacteroidota bacterium]
MGNTEDDSLKGNFPQAASGLDLSDAGNALPAKKGRKYHWSLYLLLSLSSGVLLSSGWLAPALTPVIFFAWIPLFRLEQMLDEEENRGRGRRFFGWAYLSMLSWNIISTWWIINSTLWGAIAAFVFNALFMTVPLVLYRRTRRSSGGLVGAMALVFYWLCFEYLHQNWDLSWSWLNLGHVFAFRIWDVQWYEFTGPLGGSLWILVINLLIFTAMRLPHNKWRYLGSAFALYVIPVLWSLSWSFSPDSKVGNENDPTKHPVKIIVLQPNVDPYTAKFAGTPEFIPVEEQIRRFIELTEMRLTKDSCIVLWPETAVDEVVSEDNLTGNTLIVQLQDFAAKHPTMTLITGLSTWKHYADKAHATPSARFRDDLGYFDVFNSALSIQHGQPFQLYHKSMLVPGVERLPYPKFFGLLTSLSIELGGASGGLGYQDYRSVFKTGQGPIAPVICYESAYGDYLTGFIRNGAHMIGIITNDGWWGNTPGHKHHWAYAKLRAIETRRYIARSANTGISGYIDPSGIEMQMLEYLDVNVCNIGNAFSSCNDCCMRRNASCRRHKSTNES